MSNLDTYTQNFVRSAEDPWFFLTHAVYTKDQVDAKNPVKRFPAEYPYLNLYTRIWERDKKICVPKSRRMTMSWTNIALYLWAALFSKNQDFAFVSKKEDDAAELVQRAEFIYDHIPDDFIPREMLPKKEVKSRPPSLRFVENDSKIQGFPMGADQLRQFTFSGILGDECAFWEEAKKFYSSAVPTIEGGGRMTLISSRSPGLFQRIVYDQLDNEAPIDEATTPPKFFPYGDDSVILWRNPKNGFVVADIHYTANPNKRDDTFKETVRAQMPIKEFMVEYERNWEVFSGRPVYEDYSKAAHETEDLLEPHLGLPLLLGWDFGNTPACIAAQYRGNTIYVLREYVSERDSIQSFAPKVMRDLRIRYPGWSHPENDFRHYIDPAGLKANEVNARTCAQEMWSQGIRSIYPGPITFEARRSSVEKFLLRRGGLKLNPRQSPMLARGFAGGYCYPEKTAIVEPTQIKPVKDKFSHPHDAFQYLCGGALGLTSQMRSSLVPTPRYSFTEGPPKEEPKSNKSEYGITKEELRYARRL